MDTPRDATRHQAREKQERLRLEILQANLRARRIDAQKQNEHRAWAATQKWLQCGFATELARRLMDAVRGEEARAAFQKMIVDADDARYFRRHLSHIDLWTVDYHFLHRYTQMMPPGGGHPRTVRISPAFESLLQEIAPPSVGGAVDVHRSFATLLEKCAPNSSRRVFVKSYTIARLFAMNDYVCEKAFVFAVVCLSRWLSATNFPQGVYGQWPPTPPAGTLPPLPPLVVVDIEPPADDDASPRSRIGLPAASSNG